MPAPIESKELVRRRLARRPVASTLGPWQLVQLVGEGRWTQAFQARPLSSAEGFSADYLVKALRPAYDNDPLAISLLQREAHVADQVRHPNLAAILTARVEAAPRFLVMPYLQGVTLRQALHIATRINVPQALWLARQAAEGLQALHQAGWLHGDVKPDNVFVCANGHALLLDLGLSRRFDKHRSPDERLATSLAYAAPELFTPHIAIGAASDIYGLGITLYEMLTGTRPFEQDDPAELAAAHLTAAMPDPRRRLPQLAMRITRFLRRMLAKDPLRRPAIGELIDRLCELEIEMFDERIPA